jgi:hypothetical protein
LDGKAKNKALAAAVDTDYIVSDVSASGESNDNPKKRHRGQDSNEGTETSSNGDSSSSGSSSPRSHEKEDSSGTADGNTGEDGPSTKRVRVVEPAVKSLARSGSDSGELSSESSWGSSEDGANSTEGDGCSLSKLTGSRARVLKNSCMYAREMSSISASGSDNGCSASGSDNDSSQGSDDGKDGKD